MKLTSLMLLFFFSSNTQKHNVNITKQTLENEYLLCHDYEIIVEEKGDLDRDGIDEKVIVYNTGIRTDDGYIREIQILKKSNKVWEIWRKSRNAILKSDQGGILGDPFKGIKIHKGVLIISVTGGSSWKWFKEDKYRFQNNEFELIGQTSIFGKTCEYWRSFDFNLSTGKIIYQKEYDYCEENEKKYNSNNEIFKKKGIKINLNNRNTAEIKIVSPKYKHELYL